MTTSCPAVVPGSCVSIAALRLLSPELLVVPLQNDEDFDKRKAQQCVAPNSKSRNTPPPMEQVQYE